jgi:hypothetical protein
MGLSVVIVACANPACGKEFTKPRREFNRSEKLGREHFCCLKCFGQFRGLSNFKDKINTSTAHLKKGSDRDEFSPFRYHLKRIKTSVKERNKEFSVTLEDLKLLWENQQGICPYTGWNLVLLPCTTDYESTPLTPNRASVDRKDPFKGYIADNIQFVAVVANYAKNTFTEQELIEFCGTVNRFIILEPETCSFMRDLNIDETSNIQKLTTGSTKSLILGTRIDEYFPFRHYLKMAKKNAKAKGKECTITAQYLKDLWEKQDGRCPYAGWELNYPSTTRKWISYKLHPRQASLDRIDSSLGYVPGNVQFVSVIANYAKNSFSENELLKFCKAVVDYRLKNQ